MTAIAPRLLASQVAATAPWALSLDLAAVRAVRDVDAVEAAYAADTNATSYVALLLAAHYLTVATFCPTDVDSRIRHHIWVHSERDHVAALVDLVDDIARHDARNVSARTVDDGAGRALSGHDGEWLSVRAGALGRALTLGDATLADRLASAIDDELTREATVFRAALAAPDLAHLLRVSTVVAHNLGDLSRVVEQWPRSPAHDALRPRYVRLGHDEGDARHGGVFATAGAVNKAVMATENHRFLGLRKARVLRTDRELLLPIGPFFEPWGRRLAARLDDEGRVEVAAALLETWIRGTEQQGVLRALRGLVEGGRGSFGALAAELPVRLRKVAAEGAVTAALRMPDEVFRARLENRARAALKGRATTSVTQGTAAH